MPPFVRPERKVCMQVAQEALVPNPTPPACPNGGTIPPSALDTINLQYQYRVRAAILRKCNATNGVVDDLEWCENLCDALHPDGSEAEAACVYDCAQTAAAQLETIDAQYNAAFEAAGAWFNTACLAACPA